MSGEWAGVRDASWFSHPDTRSAKVIHVAATGGVAACDSRVPLCESPSWSPISTVKLRSRCRRRACAAMFDSADIVNRKLPDA